MTSINSYTFRYRGAILREFSITKQYKSNRRRYCVALINHSSEGQAVLSLACWTFIPLFYKNPWRYQHGVETYRSLKCVMNCALLGNMSVDVLTVRMCTVGVIQNGGFVDYSNSWIGKNCVRELVCSNCYCCTTLQTKKLELHSVTKLILEPKMANPIRTEVAPKQREEVGISSTRTKGHFVQRTAVFRCCSIR
jgi:hypothetical protein